MAALFNARRKFGIGIFLCALGVMHFLETYLAAVFFIQLPIGLISPGSTVMFSGKLIMLLLLYIKEDAEAVRQPIYGLLVGNFLMVGLALFLRLYEPAAAVPGKQPDLHFIDEMGVLMAWGTILLFIDSIAIILIYEKLRRGVTNTVVGRIFISSALVLSFDQVLFFIGLHFVTGVPFSALTGGWVAKMGAAAVYSVALGVYLRYFEAKSSQAMSQPLSSVFDRLTFRHRYEELLLKTGIDGLTGAKDRGQFETLGQSAIDRALDHGESISLMMIDIDHFKRINDRYGHVAGDKVLRDVCDLLASSLRKKDMLFRYGGEEFAVICEGLSPSAANSLAERMRITVASSTALSAFDGAVTVSIGVATRIKGPAHLEDLLKDADAHLYTAKRLGRNRTVSDEFQAQSLT